MLIPRDRTGQLTVLPLLGYTMYLLLDLPNHMMTMRAMSLPCILPLSTMFPFLQTFNSYTEAMTCPDIWQDPITKELEVMHEHEVWKVVDPPPDVHLVKTCWNFGNKYDGDGELTS